jgi:hypothetical protein
MPKSLNTHAAERVDKEDFDYGTFDFPQDLVDLREKKLALDNQSRILSGFRVELPSQTVYPGRIVVHGGYALDTSGQQLFNEIQLNVSRTVTLEGADQTFYVEIEYVDSDSDVDARAFWDPTVDQGLYPSGDEKPDGQEFGNNVSTRKTPDWQVVTPIRTDNFERESDPTSTKIPLIKLTTDVSNQITGVTTEKPSSVLLEVIGTSPAVIRVQDAQFFGTATNSLIVGEGAGSQETMTVASADYDARTVTFSSAFSNSHSPGEIVRLTGASAIDLIVEEEYGRYRRPDVAAAYDYRDKMFQGDEIHGEYLSQGHGSLTDRSDISLKAMKDHIDFLAAQIQEMKWGVLDPYTSGVSTDRRPPGPIANFPGTPRYYDRAAGFQGARTAMFTVGNGTDSWGDFNAADETAIQVAINSLPPQGGTIYIKNGIYVLANTINISTSFNVELVFDEGAVIWGQTGANPALNSNFPGNLTIRGLRILPGTSSKTTIGLIIQSFAPSRFKMYDCEFYDVGIDIDVALYENTVVSGCSFLSNTEISGRGLIKTTATAGKLSGIWENCLFNHVSGTGINGACIETSTSTVGIEKANFVDCTFETAANTTSNIQLEKSSEVTFDGCFFEAAGTVSSYLSADTNGNTIKLVNCTAKDGDTPLLVATSVTHLLVDNYIYNDLGGLDGTHIQLTNCNSVQVKGCTFHLTSSTSLTNACIRAICSSLFAEDYLIANNSFNCDANNCTGVIFQDSGGTGFRDIRIENNYFSKMEVGAYFYQSGGSGEYHNVNISENGFVDYATPTEADFQKIGVLTGTGCTINKWTVSCNDFTNLNPDNTNTVIGGSARSGVHMMSATNTEIVISDNKMTNIGSSSSPITNTAAIRLADSDSATVEGNTIENVDGLDTAGIMLSESPNTAERCTVTGNSFNTITADGTNSVFGVTAYSMLNCTVADNVFADITSGGSSRGACVGAYNTGGVFSILSITGNTFYGGSDTDIWFAYFVATDNVFRTSIIGNTSFASACAGGVKILPTAGNIIQNININDNNFQMSNDRGIWIDGGSATTCNQVNVNNNIVAGGSGIGIRMDTVDLLNIVGNTVVQDAMGISIEASSLFKIVGNLVYTTTTDDNIEIDNCERLIISSNVLRSAGTTSSHRNIDMQNTCDKFLINGNICDKNGSTSGGNINNLTTSEAILALNLIDTGGGVGAPYTINTNACIDTMASLSTHPTGGGIEY